MQNEKITTGSKAIDLPLSWFLEPSEKPKVIYTDDNLEFGTPCEQLSWNHCTSTPHRPETNGIAERAVRRIEEGTYAVLLQTDVGENWWDDSMECVTAICETFKTFCLMGIHFMRGGSVNHSKAQ